MAIEQEKWSMKGGMDVVTPTIERFRRPHGALLLINYEPREEGFRRVDGYESLRDAGGTPIVVPGEGETWVWRHRDVTYAFRKGTGISTLRMWKWSGTAWVEVDMLGRVEFRAGTGTPPGNGITITGANSNARARVLRTVRVTGSYDEADEPAAGYFVVDSVVGNFTNGESISWTGKTNDDMFTIEGDYVPTAIPADGASLRFVNHNFYGNIAWEGFYCATKTFHAFAFRVEETSDEIAYPIIPPDVAERPTHVAAHKNHLFLGYPSGRVINSSLGDPLVFDAIEGAADIGIGDQISGMVGGYRNRLMIFGRNRTDMLSGTSVDEFAIDTLSEEAGAMPGTAQLMDEPIVYDDRAVRTLGATDKFGDLSVADVSGSIRPYLDQKRRDGILPVASTRSRRKSQYRVYFADGDILVMTAMPDRQGVVYEASLMRYLVKDNDTFVVTSVCSVEDSNGRERMFATGGYVNVTENDFTVEHDGLVYELDKGNLFEDTTIPCFCQLPSNDFGDPQIVKTYKKIGFEVDTYGESTQGAEFKIGATIDDNSQSVDNPRDFEALGQSAIFSRTQWSRFDFSQAADKRAELRIKGRGRTISPHMFGRGRQTVAELGRPADEPHIVTGVAIQYLIRRRVH